MKTRTKVLIGVCIAILPLIALLRFSGTYNMYRISTSGNAPALKTGDIVFTSIFKKPERRNFITYDVVDKFIEPGKEVVYVFRLCAKGGDMVEMRDGLLWVNNKLADNPDKLLFSYRLNYSQYVNLEAVISEKKYESYMNRDSSFSVTPDAVTAKEWQASYHLIIDTHKKGYQEDFPVHDDIKSRDSSSTRDNFGPFRMPEGKWLTLGDNRHNALDSRYTGFVDEEDFVGTVLGKEL